MGIHTPDATSTPTTHQLLRGRKGIHSQDNSIQSSIELSGERYELRSRSKEILTNRSDSRSPSASPLLNQKGLARNHRGSETESEESDSEEGTGHYFNNEYAAQRLRQESLNKLSPQQKSINKLSPIPESLTQEYIRRRKFIYNVIYGAIALGVISICAACYVNISGSNDKHPEKMSASEVLLKNVKEMAREFGNQEEDFWEYIKSSLQEVTVLEQPRCLIFLYDEKASKTMDTILKKISKTALCFLTDCKLVPVNIQGASLNTTEIINDYGQIISDYRAELENNGVMIIKHLEKIPGKAAQAFHSFCDEYTPIAKKAFIMFTLKVNRLPEGYPMSFLENFLLKLWNDIGVDDKFYPLFTRISQIVLRVKPE